MFDGQAIPEMLDGPGLDAACNLSRMTGSSFGQTIARDPVA
jgi:hypothetical protein